MNGSWRIYCKDLWGRSENWMIEAQVASKVAVTNMDEMLVFMFTEFL